MHLRLAIFCDQQCQIVKPAMCCYLVKKAIYLLKIKAYEFRCVVVFGGISHLDLATLSLKRLVDIAVF